MKPVSNEWYIEADPELIRDFNENAESYITAEHYKLAAKALGHSDTESHAMVFNAKGVLVQDYPRFNLFRVLRDGRLKDLSAALQGAVMQTVFVDKCQLFCLCMADALPFNEHQINQMRVMLSRRYPDDLQHTTLSIGPLNGPLLQFRSYDLFAGNQIDKLFGGYRDWFNQKSEQLSPQFKAVKREIGEWLERKYGINPPKKGFIEWLITQKLSSLAIKFDLEFKDNILIDGSDAKLTFSFQDNSQQSINIERSILEYCKLRSSELDNIDKDIPNSNKNAKNKSLVSQLQLHKTIFDIWLEVPDANGKKIYYEEVIKTLIQNNYIQKIEKTLQWRRRGNSISYCAGFVQTCIIKGWIKDVYSAPDLVRYLNDSFNVGIKSTTTFKQDALLGLDPKYLKPFQSMHQNLK